MKMRFNRKIKLRLNRIFIRAESCVTPTQVFSLGEGELDEEKRVKLGRD